MVRAMAEDTKADIALHLDHGNSVEVCQRGIDAAYTSVMIDGSKFDLDKNIEITKKVVELAHKKGISVEGEIGRVGGTEDGITSEVAYTDVDECTVFCQKSGVDFVAIGVGTAHGVYEGEPKINFERISQIKQSVPVPLVLHGASGLSDGILRECIKRGISKINFVTELRQAYTKGVLEALKSPEVYDPKIYQMFGRKEVKKIVIEKIKAITLC